MTIEAGHDSMVTAPDELASVLMECAMDKKRAAA
jgi:hypothetical protein